MTNKDLLKAVLFDDCCNIACEIKHINIEFFKSWLQSDYKINCYSLYKVFQLANNVLNDYNVMYCDLGYTIKVVIYKMNNSIYCDLYYNNDLIIQRTSKYKLVKLLKNGF